MDQLTFRMATGADYPQLVEFWNRHAGWDQVSQDIWEARFIHTPQGPSQIALSFLGSELIGQFIFVPHQGKAGHRLIRTYRPFAPVTATHVRLDKQLGALVWLQLYAAAATALARQADLIYFVPDPRWVRLFHKDPRFAVMPFPLYSRPLDARQQQPAPGFAVEPIAPDDERIDQVWALMTRHYENSQVRDRQYFQWKAAILGYELFLVRRGQDPVGLFALMNKGQDAVCMIGEVLSGPDPACLKAVLQCALHRSLERKKSQDKLQKAGVLATHKMLATLEELGFLPDDYTFTLILHPLNDAYQEQVLKASEWYLSAAD